jgi:hypothetical protein
MHTLSKYLDIAEFLARQNFAAMPHQCVSPVFHRAVNRCAHAKAVCACEQDARRLMTVPDTDMSE